MKRKYVGPTVECVSCERDIPKGNTAKVSLEDGKRGRKCNVCIMLDNRDGATA